MRIFELFGTWLLPATLKELREANSRMEIEKQKRLEKQKQLELERQKELEMDLMFMRMTYDNFDKFKTIFELMERITNNFKTPIRGVNMNHIIEIMGDVETLSLEAMQQLHHLKKLPWSMWYERALTMKQYLDEFNKYQ